ncbi:MAG: GNAT family N-acetyltransferase [Bacteroidia bacterium]|nr:MAG: GNAT family N-acetyltransferase [Bacteroidia bacterium]
MGVIIKTVSGNAIQPYIPDLARLRMDIFRDFPYLYEGSAAYEEGYLATYLRSEETVMVLVIDGSRVVGASSGMPMEMETNAVTRPFLEAGMSTANIFYFGESLLYSPYRGKGIGHKFFDEREKHARASGTFIITAFCAVQRPTTHPLRPKGYQPLDAFWEKRGYTRRPDLMTTFQWQDIGEKEETEKPMMFWIRKW